MEELVVEANDGKGMICKGEQLGPWNCLNGDYSGGDWCQHHRFRGGGGGA